MQTDLTNKAIIDFLKRRYKPTNFIDALKIKYRSLICPFISLIQMVKPGEKVGDVGCGSGQFLLLLSNFASPSYLFGIEITQRLIDNANNLFSELPAGSYGFKTYDGISFPEELKEMDVIFLIDVLHHVPKQNRELFIANLAKSLKPGARLVLKDIDASSPFVYCNKLHDLIFAGEIGNEISFNKAKTLLQDNGLEIIEQNKRLMYVYPHYTIVAKKK
ncbi:class I SAM-dependent methyltransferase [Ferruginibacter albus]|uniref:class I SAM-dependent methyltransferase n=1 Tax=Ferruginibacter albus TaxID=2875540 RepID=UPI001CC36C5B|nr:class I SAM-dependent methyltransferase [Ferruginibacter albus]UAY51301.1 class I SAM-dependent methyltransferase [Ferruginibacter albus]